ncbi:DUF302 domain-containing protein [Roseomonas sp. E05]|uniref:DUF302 domain-containing protein n=1 Tax=Roseomonas sp. E05 TaxID=3046310 RepID=UPI0024BB4B22|nr:DUF302 domain-containing protein [Roseomonas sp. E05]MDJ0391026.1 DUF302 domain-containing protein [Roseomonas sp. E05]
MSYCHARTTGLPFDRAVAAATEALGQHGFGVLSDIDVQATLRKKLGKETPPYRILGACNPRMADRALEAEPLIGTMLPCNVVVREREDGTVEAAAVDPVASMQAVSNPRLAETAGEVRDLLRRAVDEATG